MNSKIRLVASSLLLGLAGVSFTQAADDGTVAVAPSASAPAPESPAKEGRDGKRGQAMAERRLQQLDQNLSLTADQKQKIKDIYASAAAGAKDMTPEQRRDALKSIRQQVRAVLTADQQAKFDGMSADGEGQRGRKGGKGKKAE